MKDLEQALAAVASIFTDNMPYNDFLNLKVISMTAEKTEIEVPWSDAFIGNAHHKILHGGVTASILDCVGGLMVAADIVTRSESLEKAVLLNKLSNLGTIDLRTDFLRPGRGEVFVASAHLIRAGRKVAVARMEMHNEKGEHIAFGTGTYLVG